MLKRDTTFLVTFLTEFSQLWPNNHLLLWIVRCDNMQKCCDRIVCVQRPSVCCVYFIISFLTLAFVCYLLITLPDKSCPSGCSMFHCKDGNTVYDCSCDDGICRNAEYSQRDKYQILGWKVLLAVGGFGLLTSMCFFCYSLGYDERQRRNLERLTELQLANINAEAQAQCGESVGLVTEENEAAVMMSVVGVAEAVLATDYLANLATESAVVLDDMSTHNSSRTPISREQQFLMERDALFGINENVYSTGNPYSVLEAPRDSEVGLTELGYYEPGHAIVSASALDSTSPVTPTSPATVVSPRSQV